MWSKALGLSSEFEIERVYAESFNFRGYDTSKVGKTKGGTHSYS